MKTSCFSLFAVSSLFVGAFAAPKADINRRMFLFSLDDSASALEIVDDLYSSIQQYTRTINSTAASLNAGSTAADNATAAAAYQSAIGSITSAVDNATSQVGDLSAKRSVVRRSAVARRWENTTDTGNEVAGATENLLLDISGALNNAIASTGLPSLGDSLGPLVLSLSGLLTALDRVVDQLLALVRRLLDGVLNGLSSALIGLPV